MSWPSGTIEMHFKEILSLTEKLKRLSEDLGGIGEETIPEAIAVAKRGWNSESGRKLMERELKIGMQIREESDALRHLTEEMEKQAKEMYRAEQMNSQLAVTRIY